MPHSTDYTTPRSSEVLIKINQGQEGREHGIIPAHILKSLQKSVERKIEGLLSEGLVQSQILDKTKELTIFELENRGYINMIVKPVSITHELKVDAGKVCKQFYPTVEIIRANKLRAVTSDGIVDFDIQIKKAACINATRKKPVDQNRFIIERGGSLWIKESDTSDVPDSYTPDYFNKSQGFSALSTSNGSQSLKIGAVSGMWATNSYPFYGYFGVKIPEIATSNKKVFTHVMFGMGYNGTTELLNNPVLYGLSTGATMKNSVDDGDPWIPNAGIQFCMYPFKRPIGDRCLFNIYPYERRIQNEGKVYVTYVDKMTSEPKIMGGASIGETDLATSSTMSSKHGKTATAFIGYENAYQIKNFAKLKYLIAANLFYSEKMTVTSPIAKYSFTNSFFKEVCEATNCTVVPSVESYASGNLMMKWSAFTGMDIHPINNNVINLFAGVTGSENANMKADTYGNSEGLLDKIFRTVSGCSIMVGVSTKIKLLSIYLKPTLFGKIGIVNGFPKQSIGFSVQLDT